MTEKLISLGYEMETPEEAGILEFIPVTPTLNELTARIMLVGCCTFPRIGRYDTLYAGVANFVRSRYPKKKLVRRTVILTEEGMVVRESGQRSAYMAKRFEICPFMHLSLE